jgi:AsmA protein
MVRKLALVLGGIVAVVVVAFGAVVLLLQTGAASERVKNLVVPKVSAALGREVTVQGARLRVLPNPRVALTGTTIAGRPGEPPLAKVSSFDVQLGLWPLLRSFGKEIRVDGVTLVRPELNLVRARDGTWNHEGLGGSGAPAARGGPTSPPAESGGEGTRFFVARARIEDGSVRIVDASQGRADAAVALTHVDLDATGGLGEKLDAKLGAALAADQKNVEVALSSPRLPDKLGPGSYPQLDGRLALKALELQRLRGLLPANLAQMFTGGVVSCEAKISSEKAEQGGLAYRLDGDGKLSALKLRGEPASGSFRLQGRGEPARGAMQVQVTQLAVKGPGVDLGGTASVETRPTRARFAITGQLLDVGTVLGLVPAGPAAAPPPKPADTGALLPPALAREVEEVAVNGTIQLAKLVNGKLTATDLRAKAGLKGGVLTIEDATAGLYGGRVDAGGTTVAIAEPHPRWRLKARLDAVDLGQAFAAVAGAAPLAGKATGSLDLAGVGSNWSELRNVLTGLGALSVKEGALTTKDLGGEALGAVAQGLQALGKGGAAGRVAALEGGKTTLRDLAASFTVKDGFLALARPLSFSTPAGSVRLGGRIGLAQQLALEGGFRLSKDALARLGVPALAAGSGIELPMKLGGTLEAPAPSFDATKAISGAARGLVAEKRHEVEQDVKRQARKGAEDLLRNLGR